MTHRVLQPAGWPVPRGYANGVAASGRLVFVAGQIGWNEHGHMAGDDFVVQVRQALHNVLAVLAQDGADARHIARMTWYVTDRGEYLARAKEIGLAFRELIGHYAIAMTAVEVTALMEPRARVEIEVTAVVPA